MYAKKNILALFFCLISVSLLAQKIDTTVIMRTYKINPESLYADSVPLDTSISSTHFYNPVFKNSFTNTYLGNTGSPAQTNVFSDRKLKYPFIFAEPYRVYLHDPYNIYHFNTRKPFTEVSYLSSGNRDNSEQVISATHTQNVNQYVNIGLVYDLIASRGKYLNQNISSNRFSLHGSYDKDNYSIYGSANFNSVKSQENGGLVNVDDFLDGTLEELNYLMYLDKADSRFKNYSYFITQKLNLIRTKTLDSTKAEVKTPFTIQHTLHYNRFVKSYTDEISNSDSLNYYANNYYWINKADDSAFYHNLSNRFDLSFTFGKETQELRAYIMHELLNYSFQYPVQTIDTAGNDTLVSGIQKETYNDISIGGIYQGNVGNWAYDAFGSLYLTGYQAGDVRAGVSFRRYFNNRERMLELSGSFSSLKPDYFLNNYSSSHFKWKNAFLNTDYIGANLFYSGKNDFTLKSAVDYYTGYIYFNNNALPAQNQDVMIVGSLLLTKGFEWGPLHHKHRILLQKSTSDVVHIPWLAYGNSTYLESAFFKDVLKFQIGFDFYFFNRYYADTFVPATGMFVQQNIRKTGEYPYLDAFLNWKIKRTRFSLKYTNALAGVVSNDYFMAYRYPNFNGTLRFGLSWTFYD